MAVVGFGPGERDVFQSDFWLRVHHAAEERLDVLMLRLDGILFEQSSSGSTQRFAELFMFVESTGGLREVAFPVRHLLFVIPNCFLSWFDSDSIVELRGLLFWGLYRFVFLWSTSRFEFGYSWRQNLFVNSAHSLLDVIVDVASSDVLGGQHRVGDISEVSVFVAKMVNKVG